MASGTNVNNVQQTYAAASGYTYWRPLVVGASSGQAEGFTPSTKTDQVYTFSTIKCQPSTGTISANFKGSLTGTASGNLKSGDNVSSLTNDAGYLTSSSASSATPQALGTAAAGSSTDYSRADHVHAKPTYSKSDVGLGNVDNVRQYSASNPPPYPVTSVNGSTGAVSLSIPSKTSDLTNDSSYVTDADIPASTSISGTGLVTFKNSSGTALFTLQLPLYNGGAN